MKAKDIVQKCRQLVIDKGTAGTQYKYFGGLVSKNYLEYTVYDENGSITITKDNDSENMEVTIHGLYTSAGNPGNPAICVTEDGRLIRFHGEMHNAVHLLSL